jgi:hypothetical protein
VSEGRSFQGSPRTGGRGERRFTAIVGALLIGFIGIAIAKPWGSPVEPAPSARPPVADATPPAASLQAATPGVPSPAPSATVGPLPVAFTSPLAPASASASATWTGLDWRRLAPDDPLSLVTSIVRWRRGFIAVGRIAAPPSTPIWTSADGTRWDALPSSTSSTFWPGHAVLGIAELATGLVALTETVEYCGEPCPLTYELPIVSWTSPDGRTWTPRLLPPEWLAEPSGQPPLFAVGPAGLVVASSGPAARLATSPDGSQWHLLPASGFPARFALNDLHGTATGYVALGRWMPTDSRREAASLWSSDGRRWSEMPTILSTSAQAGSDVGSAGASLVVGRDGMVAVGRGVTTPGAALWWQSANGRDWRPLPTFAPLGPTTCIGKGCGLQPNGALVGDGHRMVAARGGADGGAWTSSDGLTWQRLQATGELPAEQATEAVLLPGGVLLTDGTTTWFGEAQAP